MSWSEKILAPLLANWPLIAVAIWGILVARRTLNTIEKQTKATEENVNALINSERAWIMVDIELDPECRGIVETTKMIGDLLEHNTNLPVVCICRNQGKSPAWITNKRIKFEIVDSIPAAPKLESTDLFQTELEPLAAGGDSRTKIDCNCGGRLDLPQIGIIYGVVEYRDIFGRPRSTTFGYVVTMLNTLLPQRLERISGFHKYNENT